MKYKQKDPWDEEQSSVYDCVQWLFILIYISPWIALTFVNIYLVAHFYDTADPTGNWHWIVNPPDNWMGRIGNNFILIVVAFPTIFLAATCLHKAKKHAHLFMNCIRKKNSQSNEPTLKTTGDSVDV